MSTLLGVAPPGSDPAGALLAPTTADGGLDLAALPHGTGLGECDLASTPQGTRNAVNKIDGSWVWRLLSGEGWAVRQGKGPERPNGTRPKLAILEPCTSIALRAVGLDLEFGRLSHHAVIVWVRLTRTGATAPDGAWMWTSEPGPTGSAGAGGRVWTSPPRRIGVQACRQVLAQPPDARVVDAALAAARAADPDQDVST